MRRLILAITLGAALTGLASTQGVAQSHLRIGLQDDPDVMDPTLARSFAGRIVFASLCDKLFDINERLEFVPQLATGHKTSEDGKTVTITLRPGVRFHDGQKFDAAAAKFSLERHLTMPGSFRRAEISSIVSVEVVDPLTIQLTLSAPFAPLIAQLSDRAGMMVSPAAAKAAGANFSRKPVCAGPFKFVERVAQNRIVVERFADYWDRSRIFFDKVTYLPIPDSTVRLANLQAGGLDLIERLAPTDMDAVRGNPKLRLATGDSLAFQSLTLNLNNGEKSNTPFGKDPRVRQAFELAIDRNVINQVVYNGEFLVGNQWVSPVNPYYQKTLPVPARDIAKAKALLKEAGVATPLTLSLMVINAPDQRQVAEVIQSMVREAGFDVKLQATEFAASLDAAQKGDFQIYLANWSGRTDPDGNLYSFHSCKGPQNNGHYCNPEVDALLDQSRATGDPEERMKLFEQIARKVLAESQSIYLFHPKLLHAHSVKLQGYKLLPDGIVRLQGVKLN
jgi:peptide/nickel transport system substrate-binding protein